MQQSGAGQKGRQMARQLSLSGGSGMFRVCLFSDLQHVSLGQEWLHNLQGTGGKKGRTIYSKIIKNFERATAKH